MHLGFTESQTRRAFLGSAGALALGLAGCSLAQRDANQESSTSATGSNVDSETDDQGESEAAANESASQLTSDENGLIAGKLAVFDLHSDTLGRREMQDSECWKNFLTNIGFDPSTNEGDLRSNTGALDLERMQKLSYFQCFGIWMDTDDPANALAFYRKARDRFKYDITENNSDLAGIAQTDDNKTAMQAAMELSQQGKVAALLTVENASMIGDDISIVDEMISDGVIMSTLTWGGKNSLGSNPSTTDGLTEMGKEVVSRFEEGNIVVDVSHLNDEGFYDLLAIHKRPFVASHSNSRAVCNCPRNLTDDMFRALVDMGGLVGMNFYRSYLTERSTPSTGEVTFDEFCSHIDHWLSLGGEDVIAIGTDYDGSDVPAWIESCSDMPDLHAKLADRFGQDVINKMFFQNAYAFFSRYEQGF